MPALAHQVLERHQLLVRFGEVALLAGDARPGMAHLPQHLVGVRRTVQGDLELLVAALVPRASVLDVAGSEQQAPGGAGGGRRAEHVAVVELLLANGLQDRERALPLALK